MANQPILIDLGQGLSMMLGQPTLASWDTNHRPKKPKTGTFGFNFETNSLEYWNGSYWLGAEMTEL